MAPRYAPCLVGISICAFLLSGCGTSSVTSTGDDDRGTQIALDELTNLLKTYIEEKRRPPTSANQLEAYSSSFAFATAAIQQKKIVYRWGAGPGSGTAVLAHEANAETAGGWVLLQDGTLKKMSADEFKAAPKAK